MRADKYLSDKYGSRTKAAAAITAGLVLVNGKKIQPSYEIKPSDNVQFSKAEESFVSVGGCKLSKALKDFNYSAEGKIFADIGASTGGFTDCLLQNNASKVYCIDVGESQLDKKLICDKTVIIDNFNARYLSRDLFADKLDGIVIDVSFISLTYILDGVSKVLDDGKDVLALIKPQFECESKHVGKNGIVRDAEIRGKIICKIIDFSADCGLYTQAITNAPINPGKNLEYIIWLKKAVNTGIDKRKLFYSIKL